MEGQEEKLPIVLTFEIVQHAFPNDHWYDVTAVISSPEAEFVRRLDTALCLQKEIGELKEAHRFLLGKHFAIREVREQGSSGEEGEH